MALHTVAQLKDSVAGLLSGIDLQNIDNLNGAIERAASILVQKADVPEASGIQNITLYSGVLGYPCDPRIFGTAINDIRPQGISRSPNDFVVKIGQEQFDRTKGLFPSGTMSTFEYDAGVPIIKIKAPFTVQEVVIDPMNSVGNSPNAWVAGGTASNIQQDNTVYYQSPASLRFALSGSGIGTLSKTLQSPLSLASYQGVGVCFLAIEIPPGADATTLTGMTVRLGSDSSNYSEVSNTTGFLGAWVSGEFLIVAFDQSLSVDTGTPNWSAIQYAECRFAHTGTLTNFRVGSLFISLPSQAQILYQSAAIFKNTAGVVSTTITPNDNTDRVILADPSYVLFMYESALSVLEQTGAGASDSTYIKWNQKLNGNGSTDAGLYAYFRGDNPSQEIRTTGSYYDTGNSYSSGW